MPSKYPVLKPVDVIRVLTKFGFVLKSQKGSHAKYVKTTLHTAKMTVIIPMHNEIAKGTFRSILEQAGITLEEFMEKF